MLSMELRMVVVIYVLISLLKTSEAELQNEQPHVSQGSLMPSVCRKDLNGSSLSVEIRLPFMDMELRHERSCHVLREQQLLLMLHGHELFQLQLGGRQKRLVRLGELAGQVRQQLSTAAAVISWREYMLLAVALEQTLEVYQLPQVAMMEPAQFRFEPIQQFALPAKLKQMQLLKPAQDQEQILLMLAINFTQTQSKCKTFEWLETYFNPVEDLTMPAFKTFQLVGRQPHYLITGRSLRNSQTKLVLTIYELETPSLRLLRRQSLTVQARHVLAVRFRGRNWLFACGSNPATACILFRMVEGNFVVYRKHVLRQLHFSHLMASEQGQLLAGARENGEVLVFNSHRLDCYSGFVIDANPNGLFTHRNAQNESFLLLVYQRNPSTTLMRMVQLGGVSEATTLGANLEGNDDLSSVQQHRHEFEETISALRSQLLRRKLQLDAVRQLTQKLDQRTVILEQPLHMRSGGRIEQVHLQGHHLSSPTQLQQRVEQLRQKYALNSRHRRSFGVGNASTAGQETLKVRDLHVQNLIYHGELLPGYYLDTTGSSPLLTIKGQVLTKRLQTEQLLTPQSYERPRRSFDPQQLQEQQHTVVRHLQVDRINNVSWFDFYDSLFLHSRDNQIEGRLIVQSRARVVNLQTPLLNGLVVQQLFNLRQPQLVSSNLFMSAFFAPKVDAQLVNGLNFNKDIVFRFSNNSLIETPVRINQMSVSGDLFVANDTKLSRQMDDEPLPGQLQQYYTGRVIINGSLRVNNLQRDTITTRIQLADGQSLRKEDIHANYLLLHEPQNLTELSFGNAKITTPSLNTAHIQGHPTEEHLLTSSNQDETKFKKPLHIIFMNASIEGDLICTNYSSRLAELSKDAVRQGETANITGHKHFEAALSVETLRSTTLNGIAVQDLVLKTQLMALNFTQRKYFPRIVVKQNLAIKDNLISQQLNHLPMSQLLQPAYSLQRLELLDTPKLQHLILQRLNGLDIDALLSVDSKEQLLLHKQLIIEGNVRFEQDLQLHTLNNIKWDEYVADLVPANANALITSRKIFEQPVLITDALHAPSINGLNLSALLDNTLLRATPQAITGDYTFDRMWASNLDVDSINGVPAASMLDMRQPKLQLQGDLYLQQLTVNGSLSCSLANDPLPQLATQLAALQQRNWSKLFVHGDALWPMEQPQSPTQQSLDYLRQHAVRRTGAAQIITGNVVLEQPYLGSVRSKQNFPRNLNLTHIAQDALLRRSNETQLIEAPQEMLQFVQAKSIRLLQDCHFETLNHIEPLRLNASLYRRSSGLPIAAQLHFETPPRLGKLLLQGQLNGISTRGIYVQTEDTSWPAVRLRQLQVQQDLHLGEINGMNLEYYLQQRVPLRGAAALELFGQLSFEHLLLGDHVRLRTINGISLQNVVYKHGKQTQSITGSKTFLQGIELQGPAHVLRLNGQDLSESYQQTIFTDRDYNIDSLVLDGATFQSGLILDDSPIVGAARKVDESDPKKELQQQLQQLEEQVQQNQLEHSPRLLYLDYEPQLLQPVWSEPAANASLQLQTTYRPISTSICQLKELRAQIPNSELNVHLSNVSLSSRLLRVSSKHARIKLQNYCRPQKLKCRIHISCHGQEAHTLGMREQVESVQLLERHSFSLLLLSTKAEVRVLRLQHDNCSLIDWQSLQPAAGRLMQLLQLNEDTQLLLTSGLQQHMPVVAVHRLNSSSQRLELLQLIDGDYDLAVLQNQELLLSCHSCHHISVHVYNTVTQLFAPLQQLRLEARIQQLLPFAVGQERYLLVLTLPGSIHFYLLSYEHIEGWKQRTYGQMGEFLWSWPLLKPDAQLARTTSLLLLCGQLKCSLVSALVG